MTKARRKDMRQYLRWAALSLFAGVLAGIAAFLFLDSLDWATRTRMAHSELIWLLPVAGFLVGWLYHHLGRDVVPGNNLILDEIHNPRKVVPFKMAPFILVSTVVTHLFGGSAGREGTAVQMGASLADQISKWFRMSHDERRVLLVAGAGAGFGAAIGAPWAGVLFGLEVIEIGRLRFFAWFECLLASFAGYYTTVVLGAPHSHYPAVVIPHPEFKTVLSVLAAGVAFGLVARLFASCTHWLEKIEARFIPYPPLKPLFAGIAVVLLYRAVGTYRYAGLGIEVIQQALTEPADWQDPMYKLLFTSLTVGSGFKGGEFIPLVFIGTTFGSALSLFLPASFGVLGAIGFASVFAAAANTPLACTVMAMEIFGYQIAPYALLSCLAAYYFSGHNGIYRSQKVHRGKAQQLKAVARFFGNLSGRFF